MIQYITVSGLFKGGLLHPDGTTFPGEKRWPCLSVTPAQRNFPPEIKKAKGNTPLGLFRLLK
jgi:hypothetical protein